MTVAQRRAQHGMPSVVSVVLAVAVAGLAVAAVVLFRHSSSSNAVAGSGVAASQARFVASFRSVELAGSNNVTIRVGRKQSVVVHADDNLLSRVTTHVGAANLVIGNTVGTFKTNSPMWVDVSVPSLQALTLSGSGSIAATGVKASRLTVAITGSGVIRATGAATRLDVSLVGSGDAELAGLVAKDVKATVHGSGPILVTATRSLDAAVPGSGVVIYGGNPADVRTSISGSGAVTRG